MKKLLTIIIVIALTAPFFTACKKGENDPGLSIKSRTSRLTGEWELTEMERTSTSTYSGTSSTSITTFNGSNMTSTSGSYTSTSIYSETIEIMKDGTYKSNTNQTYTESGNIYTNSSEGTWAWVSGNKEDEYKNKERICFTTTSSTSTSSYGGSSSTSIFSADGDNNDLYVMKIDELSSKTLVFTREYNDNDDGDTYTVSETSTYEKK